MTDRMYRGVCSHPTLVDPRNKIPGSRMYCSMCGEQMVVSQLAHTVYHPNGDQTKDVLNYWTPVSRGRFGIDGE